MATCSTADHSSQAKSNDWACISYHTTGFSVVRSAQIPIIQPTITRHVCTVHENSRSAASVPNNLHFRKLSLFNLPLNLRDLIHESTEGKPATLARDSRTVPAADAKAMKWVVLPRVVLPAGALVAVGFYCTFWRLLAVDGE